MLKPENVKLKQNYIWDVIEIDWKEVNVTFNSNKINMPKSITIKFRDKFKIRHMVEREPFLIHIMLRQGFNWFTLASGNPPTETVYVNLYTFPERISTSEPSVTFSSTTFCCTLSEDMIDAEVTIHTVDGIHTNRRERNTQAASYSPWSRQVKPFLPLGRKVQNIKRRRGEVSIPFPK